jgi:hypothetical protein
MRTESEIISRIGEIKAQLDLLENKRAGEFRKHIRKKDYRLLLFLHMEIKKYDIALSQLEWSLETK